MKPRRDYGAGVSAHRSICDS